LKTTEQSIHLGREERERRGEREGAKRRIGRGKRGEGERGIGISDC